MPINAEELGFSPVTTNRQNDDLNRGSCSAKNVLSAGGISAWLHDATGVRVVKFSAPGPLVSLTIFVGTEPWSDAGHPHSLEHIVFLGSKLYPQRGFLDALAHHGPGDGTNATTSTEYTSYTAVTAGYEGMISLLPCFLDHIFRPVIDESGVMTEVYHVRPDGKEAGVVFCEMHAREHTEHDMMEREVRQVLFEGCSLQFEAGGLCDAIRGLTTEEIRRYHAENYCGANVSIILGGSAEYPCVGLLKSISNALQAIASDPNFRRGSVPWQKKIVLAPMKPRVQKKAVRFPSVDEEIGSVAIAWRGNGVMNPYRNLARNVLLGYLCDTPESPLKQRYVMTEDPLCSDIFYEIEMFSQASTYTLVCSGIAHMDIEDDKYSASASSEVESNDVCDEATWSTHNGHAASASDAHSSLLESEQVGTILLDYLADVVRKQSLPGGLQAVKSSIAQHREDFLSALETEPHEVIPNSMIEELIYGLNAEAMIGSDVRGELDRLRDLEKESETFWLQLLDTSFVSEARVEVYMIPDCALASEMAADDDKQTRIRREKLAENAQTTLQESMDGMRAALSSGELCSKSFLTRPSLEHVSRLAYRSSYTITGSYFADSVTIDANLIHANILFSTNGLSLKQRAILPLLAELLLSLDIRLDDGSVISYADSSRELNDATVNTNQSGVIFDRLSRMQSDGFGINYAATTESFERATSLIFRLLFHGHVTNERVSSAAKNAHSELLECLRDGSIVLSSGIDVLPALCSTKVGATDVFNAELTCMFSSERLLGFIADEYSREKPRKQVRRKFLQLLSSALRNLREQPAKHIYVHVTARNPASAHKIIEREFSRCWRPEEALENPLNGGLETSDSVNKSDFPLTRPKTPLLKTLIPGTGLARGVGIAGIESSFLEVRVDSDAIPGHALWPSVAVMIQMLSRTEGPVYRAVRGSGLAYGVMLRQDRWQRKLCLAINESSAPCDAWLAVCRELREFRTSLEKDERSEQMSVELNIAKSVVVYNLVEARATPSEIAYEAVANRALGNVVGQLADRILEDAVEAVDVTSVRQAFDTFACKLLQSDYRLAMLTCNSSIIDVMMEKFRHCSDPIDFEIMTTDDLCLPQINRMVSTMEKMK